MNGVDVSNLQGGVNWARAQAAGGVDFAIVKATEGVGFDDAWFAHNWGELARLDIPRGAYHFARPSANSPQAEGAHFLAAIAAVGLAKGDLVALDIEDPDLPVGGDAGSWSLAWLAIVEAALGFKPLVYTYPSYIGERRLNLPALAAYPLWFATYDEPPLQPGTWPGYAIRQYSASGTVPGIGAVDLDSFNGTREELLALGRPGATPAPEPAGGVGYSIGSRGNTVLTIDFGGIATAVEGVALVDVGVTVVNRAGERYSRSLKGGQFEPWHKDS